ncbi:MAG: hypothetical protein OEL54_06915, partial [Flavobacteriaceae bacterium]|nr:hypothetical protein [Flavobacteriaceae bacterium]
VKDNGILPLIKKDSFFSHLKLFLYKRRIEFFIEVSRNRDYLKKIFDQDKNKFENFSFEDKENYLHYYGGKLDLTDNRLDPHKGVRIATRKVVPNYTNYFISDYNIMDYNLRLYVPFFKRDVFTFNLFRSKATVTNRGVTDETELRSILSLNCETKVEVEACMRIEDMKVKNQLEENLYGTATYMGGPNRMRAYDIFRFKGGNSFYAGMEYRYNFSSNQAPLNWYFIGGLKTIFQVAFFMEQGTVANDPKDLYQNFKPSYGVGFRAIVSGLVYRFDISNGNEGITTTLFFDYPMDIIFLGS